MQHNQHINYVLDTLLEWRRSDDYEQFNLHRLIDELEDEMKLQMKNKNMSLEINTLSIPKSVHSEKGIQTILRNLISNAINYSPENSKIDIDIKYDSISVSNLTIDHASHGTRLGHTLIDALCEKLDLKFEFNKQEERAISTLYFI